MEKIRPVNGDILREDDDLGLMFRKLESVENFFPCYKTLIKKEK